MLSYTFHTQSFSIPTNTSLNIQQTKFCSNKYLFIENQMLEDETMS